MVVSSLCQTLDIELTDWPKNLRHVRDFWNSGSPWVGELVDPSEAQAGDLLVIRKAITVDGVRALRPVHLAIVSRVCNGELTVIHAKLNPREIAEEQLENVWRERIAGAIAINTEKLQSGALDFEAPTSVH